MQSTIDEFKKFLTAEYRYADETAYLYWADVTHFHKYLQRRFEVETWADVTQFEVYKFKRYMAGKAEITIWRRIRALELFFNYLAAFGVIKVSPVPKGYFYAD